MRVSPALLTVALAAILPATQAGAVTAEDIPNFSCEDALNCLAYKTAALGHDPSGKGEDDVIELDFWVQVIEVKRAPDQVASHEAEYAEALTRARAVYEDKTLSAAELDEELTMMAKFCWFQALTVPDVGPFAEE